MTMLRRVLVLAMLASLATPARAATPVAEPTVTGPVTGGIRTGGPFLAVPFDLAPHGYVEEEFFISGTATSASNPLPAPYATRVLVRRPVDPERFNGTVLLEWFNVTSTYDLDVDWSYLHGEFFRSGQAYVGVSAQLVGVQGGPNSLKFWDPVRYATLVHPGDGYAHDIFSQAAKTIPAVLGGLEAQRVLASGQSQSAGQLNGYINTYYPSHEHVIDGFMPGGANGTLREDLDVPVVRINSDNEANGRSQPDSAFYRHWEVAGSAHASRFQADYHTVVMDRDYGMPPGVHWFLVPQDEEDCLTNRFPKQYGVRAAFVALERWVRDGTPPANAPRETVVDGVKQRDEHGNVLAGIRHPAIEVPTATYNNGTPCGDPVLGTYGRTDLFDDATLAALYPTPDDYVGAVDEAAERAVTEGFLLEADAAEIMTEARSGA